MKKINSIKLPKNIKNNIIFYKYLKKHNLNTICEKLLCPNIYKCFNNKTAAFMILGKICTRKCPFCNIKKGKPNNEIDKNEIKNILKTIIHMKLKYVTITSVTRDDLKDEGLYYFNKCISEIKRKCPKTKIELLVPDFKKNINLAIKIFSQNPPFIFNHNLETIKRLHNLIKPNSNFNSSINLLKKIKQNNPNIITKSGIILGLGEHKQEIIQLLKKLKKIKVNIITLGQYLQPTKKHLKVKKYLTKKEFKYLKYKAYKIGFKYVYSGTLIRSSYYKINLI